MGRVFKQKDPLVDREFEQVNARLLALEGSGSAGETEYMRDHNLTVSLNTGSTANKQFIDVSEWTDASVQAVTASGSPSNLQVKVANTKGQAFDPPSGAITISAYPGLANKIDVSSIRYLILQPATSAVGVLTLDIHLRKIVP